MKLIAITHPYFFKGESQAICRLIDSGWWRVHLRKPEAYAGRVAELLDNIPRQYRKAISMHDNFDLAVEFKVGGVHLNGRNPSPPAEWQGLVSRSCHSLEELSTYSHLDYLTLSPIFDSISKPGYLSRFNQEDLRRGNLRNVVALGGVTHSRLRELESIGFGAAAMLTEAWKTRNHMLQFITPTPDGLEDILKGGCRWVQLRMKEASDEEFAAMAKRFIPICRNYDATLIFDDRVGLAKSLDADGVHLGKTDMPIALARKILGPSKIIGATANTADDVMNAFREGADYIGIGPFRFTTTKQNLAPVVGLDGYRRIMAVCRGQEMTLPVVAIGGIGLNDLCELRKTGVDGVAVSGLLLNSDNRKETTEKIIQTWGI